jgi:hypothetical protein
MPWRYGGVGIALPFLSLALGVGEWWASHSGLFTPTAEPPYPLGRRLSGFQSRYGRRGEETNLAPLGNRTPAIQHIARRYTDWTVSTHSSRNGVSADRDRAQWGRVRRRQNNGNQKNYIKTHEAKWPLEFIRNKYDCTDESQHEL